MNGLLPKRIFRTLFRVPSMEHPELETRIDHHLFGMARFSALIALLFWPLIAVMGLVAQLPNIRLLMILVGTLGFLASILFHTDGSRRKGAIVLFFFIVFPGVIALYVSSSYTRIDEAAKSYLVMRETVPYLLIKEDAVLEYVGLFDRLLSINFFYAIVVIFVAIAPLKFRNMPWVMIPYSAYGFLAFSGARKPNVLIIYFIVLGVGVAIKAVAELLVVESIRRQIRNEEEIKRMTRAILERDLELARDIQQSVPVPERIETSELEIEFFLKPHDLVGGDWVTVRQEQDGSFWILIVDAVGKGLQASLVVHAIQSLWTAAGRSALNGPEWIRLVNETLCTMGAKSPHCVTLGLMHLEAGRMTYWSAAHCPVLVVGEESDRRTYREVNGRGSMIGLSPDLKLVPKVMDFDQENSTHLIMCSDGLLSVVPRSRRRKEVLAMLRDNFSGTLAGLTPDDDLTVVSIRRKSASGQTQRHASA